MIFSKSDIIIKKILTLNIVPLFFLCCTTLFADNDTTEHGDSLEICVKTKKMQIIFSTNGGVPLLWKVWYPSRADSQIEAVFCENGEEPLFRIRFENNPSLNSKVENLKYRLEREEDSYCHIIRFISGQFYDSIYLEKVYRIRKNEFNIEFQLKIKGKNVEKFIKENRIELKFTYGNKFSTLPSAGFSGAGDKVKALYIKNNHTHILEEKVKGEALQEADGIEWAGFKNRFWTLIASAGKKRISITCSSTVQKENRYILFHFPDKTEHTIKFYTGPVSYKLLDKEAPELKVLLFHGLWFWMRWLCIGLLFLLDSIIRMTGNPGISIILLSISVKIMMYPLFNISDKWQYDVNEKKSKIQPFLDEIKKKYKGEEQANKISGLYKEKKIHPLYFLKSLFGCMIQIPIFLAAYHMLSENIALSGVNFLWINDLAKPDSIACLPFNIPFFGSDLNLLPFLMTVLTLLSSWKFDDGSLSPELLRKQKRNFFFMAFLFFILFYTFPAGMVLYWTMNNLLALVKVQAGNILRSRREKNIS